MRRSDRRSMFMLQLGVSAAALFTGTAAYAQQGSDAAAPAAGEQEIVVTGTRASLGRALDLKRETVGVVDAISAEDIGKFPDQNVAESLQRITGVSIDRSGGEGRFITVRGFGPEFNTVLLNGRLLATENSGREFSFDILPSELLSAAEVYKSATAEQQDGGIGSTVILRTARPLDRSGFHFSGSAAMKFDSTRDKASPVVSGILSKTNADDTFGALISINYDKRISRFSNVNTSGWIDGQNLDFDKDGTVDLANVALPRTYNTTVERNSRERIGATLALDWIVSDQLKLQLDALYTQLKVDSWSNQLGFYTDPGDIIDAEANENGTVTHFVRSAGGGLASDNIVFDSPRDAKTYQIGLNAAWTPTDRTTITFDLSHSRAKEGNTSVFYVVGAKNAGVTPTFDLNPGALPTITNILPTDDPARALLHCCSERGSIVKDDITSFRVDGKQDFDGTLKAIRFGAVGTRRKKDVTSLLTPDPLGCFYCGYFASADPNLFAVFNDGGVLGGSPMSWLTYDPAALARYYGSAAAVSQKGDPVAEAAFNAVYAANGHSLAPAFDPRGSGSVRENNAAAYLQAELGGEFGGEREWNAVIGARYVYTDTLAHGNSVQLLNITQNPGDPTAGVATFSPPVPVSEKHNYSYILPSATFRVDWTDDLVTRLAFSRTLTRPTLSNLTLSKSYDFRPPQSNTISSGNPGLKPYLAWNADVSVDYYLGKASYVSVAGFYKWVDNFISQVTTTETYFGFDFQVTRPENTRKSKVYGFEAAIQYTFDMLPAPLDGLGFSANYTKVKSSTSFDPSIIAGTFSVEGLSDSANAVLFYEKGPVQLRAAYNWRDSFLARTRGLNGQPENVDSYGQYDLSGSFKITPQLAVFGEVVNLTNKHRRTFSRYDERLIQLDDTGRRVAVGVRANF